MITPAIESTFFAIISACPIRVFILDNMVLLQTHSVGGAPHAYHIDFIPI